MRRSLPNIKISAISAISDNFANIWGMEQDIVNPKMALQTTNIPEHVHLIWWTLYQFYIAIILYEANIFSVLKI